MWFYDVMILMQQCPSFNTIFTFVDCNLNRWLVHCFTVMKAPVQTLMNIETMLVYWSAGRAEWTPWKDQCCQLDCCSWDMLTLNCFLIKTKTASLIILDSRVAYIDYFSWILKAQIVIWKFNIITGLVWYCIVKNGVDRTVWCKVNVWLGELNTVTGECEQSTGKVEH